jgi:DNA polymerase III delta prime subunit
VNSRILISPDLTNRQKVIEQELSLNNYKKLHPDVLYIEDGKKLGVEQSKKIREFLSLRPYQSKSRVVVVESAHNMTHDAQNSLLKTLEEPPEQALILLAANSEHSLLPTILSRCEIVLLGSKESGESKEPEVKQFAHDIEKLISLSLNDRFDYIEKLEDKEVFFKAFVEYFHHELFNEKKPDKHQLLEFNKKLIEAEEWYKANGNLRAILEYLMLNMPK